MARSRNSEYDMYGQQIKLNASPSYTAIEGKREVSILFAGVDDAVTQTLADNIFDQTEGSPPSLPNEESPALERYMTTTTKHGITIKIYESQLHRSSHQGISRLINRVDILIFCIRADSESIFSGGHPALIKNLQDAYGESIWKNCVVVLSYSNRALNYMKRYSKNADPETNYKEQINTCAMKFEAELKKLNGLNVFDIKVTSVLDPHDPESTIVAIPAGEMPGDPVLPGFKFKQTKIKIPATGGQPEREVLIDLRDWRDIIFIETVKKSKNELKRALVQYQYGPKLKEAAIGAATRTAVGAALGAALGASLGAAVGAFLGAAVGDFFGTAEGPPGILLGAAIGGAIGSLFKLANK